MSRGGRGGFGGRGGAGMMGGHKLPFDVDPDLEDVYKYGEDGQTEEDPALALFPPYPGGVPIAPPPTAGEKELVKIHRELIALKHAGPNYTGPPGSLKALCGKKTAATFNAFEDQQTYAKKYERKPFRLPDPKKRKWAAPHLFPKELWEHIGYNPDAGDDDGQGARKKIVLNQRTTLDKLARFDEDGDGGDAADDDPAEDEVNAEEAGDGDVEAPHDDDFDEDDDDDANDYNAEQYFDDGEDDHEEGGDEYGGGGDEGY
ncbi:DNA-directed RNA polymerase III subunit C31 [Recurvomyces mirabilis]|uniref:DNA-directed RNA polymerase III subunit n=1 Tax=Recurvomyces mirabilis TaxID=574656 RepID=A0AAE0WWL1_9PEZI|nr:DNA-directed RNA polymerase III subunit C31 [Recurvomyces mirabilis]KAK5158692.1 DNA-directed RNA polymerase III subunit C31 [Recurvomyces mirabilis]